MVAARCGLCAVLLGGCLIVRATDDPLDEPCPTIEPERLADAYGPFAIADAIYFIGHNGTLSKVSLDGGLVTELTTEPIFGLAIATDETHVYTTHQEEIVRRKLDGTEATPIASGFASVTEMITDDDSVIWASTSGLDRWIKANQTIDHLDDASLVLGLAERDGVYYYSDTHGDVIRRVPPIQDLALAHFPGPLVVDEHGVYYYEIGDQFVEYAGSIRLIPHDGGAVPAALVEDLLPVFSIARADEDLYFASGYAIEYRIKRVARTGGEPKTLACGYFEQQRLRIAVFGDYVYWSDGNGLFRMRKDAML